MKGIVVIMVFITLINLVGCSGVDSEKTINTFKDVKLHVYSQDNSKEVKDLLKSYGNSKNLEVERAIEKNMIVVDDEKIVGNENLWNDFYNNIGINKEGSVLIVQYTEQNDPILTYLSYRGNKYFMMEDYSRDRYRESKEKYYFEYSFNSLNLYEENNKTYVYLLDDDKITLEELNDSLLSSNISDWIPYGFVFYYAK